MRDRMKRILIIYSPLLYIHIIHLILSKSHIIISHQEMVRRPVIINNIINIKKIIKDWASEKLQNSLPLKKMGEQILL